MSLGGVTSTSGDGLLEFRRLVESASHSKRSHGGGSEFSAGWSWRRRWWFAAKPMSWPKLLVPALVGQSMGASDAASWSPVAGAGGVLITVGLLCFIVFLNDAGDERVDRIKREMFPEACSPKTIPDGVLSRRALIVAGALAAIMTMFVTALLGDALARPLLPWFTAASLILFLAYSFPPLQLNYRGGGELLEMFGVGVVLPWLHLYLQSGSVWSGLLWCVPGLALTSMASALASGLSDEESDLVGGKRTFVTVFGNRAARRGAEWLVLMSCVYWVLMTRFMPDVLPWWIVAPVVALTVLYWRAIRRCSGRAQTNAFDAHRRYKALLHRAIWFGGVLLSFGFTLKAIYS